MANVKIADGKSIHDIKWWLRAHGVKMDEYDYYYETKSYDDYDDEEDLQFAPVYTFNDTVDPAIITEFALRFA
jgi:hypothetical protein